MVTEDERKNFLILRRVLLANSLREWTWEDNDTQGNEMDLENSLTSELRYVPNYNNIQLIDVPEQCVESVKSWYVREVLPKFDDVQSSMYNLIDHEPSYEGVSINFNCITKEISFRIYISFTSEAPEQSNYWDKQQIETNPELQAIFDNFSEENPDCRILRVYYYGGGDSGDIDGAECDGNYIGPSAIPSAMEDFIYENLPGGWEINEGSRGYYTFNFEEKSIELSHIEYYDDTESRVVAEDKF